jgi:beta-phosphoglucomutase-like phosphatase (HAD superfamily)
MIKRILFDLDGVLFDTQIFHSQVEAALMAEFGVSVDPKEISLTYAGRPTESIFQEILGCDEKTAKDLAKRKWEYLLPRATEARQLCDLTKLFVKICEKDVAMSIGTSSPSQWAHDLLRLHGLEHFFESTEIIGGDMISCGKPDPEIWLKAALDTPAEHCLVVEDGIAGAKGAMAAGMSCALILPNIFPGAIQITTADDVIDLLS